MAFTDYCNSGRLFHISELGFYTQCAFVIEPNEKILRWLISPLFPVMFRFGDNGFLSRIKHRIKNHHHESYYDHHPSVLLFLYMPNRFWPVSKQYRHIAGGKRNFFSQSKTNTQFFRHQQAKEGQNRPRIPVQYSEGKIERFFQEKKVCRYCGQGCSARQHKSATQVGQIQWSYRHSLVRFARDV